MAEFDSNSRFERENRQIDPVGEVLAADKDMVMEQILDNINTTPIGQVLRKIASLPEVRKEKVLDVRRQLTEGQYDLDERLDVALDKVLEHLTA
ncbi:flagellar biosynthesis anti-sigma factor FlgM [Planctomycetota bacterium]